MFSLLRIVLAVVLLVLIVGVVLLATVDLQPPMQRIEKTIPNERFQPR
jgi:hypothetical protein